MVDSKLVIRNISYTAESKRRGRPWKGRIDVMREFIRARDFSNENERRMIYRVQWNSFLSEDGGTD